MNYRGDFSQDRGRPDGAARTVLAYSVLLLGLAGSIAMVPALIWLFVSRGLQ